MSLRADQHARHLADYLARQNPDSAREVRELHYGGFGGEALRISLEIEGMEAWFRTVLYLDALKPLAAQPPPWPTWEPWHQLQLAITDITSMFQERVYARHFADVRFVEDLIRFDDITRTNSSTVADQLRTTAGLLEKLAAGQPLDFDFEPIVRATKTVGYLPSLAAEYEYVRPLIGQPPKPLPQEPADQLRQARLGKVVEREGLLLALTADLGALQSADAADAQSVTALVRRIEGDLGPLRDDAAQQVIDQALRELAAPAPPVIAVKRRLHALTELVSSHLVQLRSQVRLPPVNTTARENRRFTSRGGLPFVWTIHALVENYDRRWVEQRRIAELGLVRAILHANETGSPPDARRDLVLQYGRMVELRARNLANEQRRNRGISILEQDAGPSLRLPKHIATEFFKARNRRSPDAFRERIERYQTDLYKDLANR